MPRHKKEESLMNLNLKQTCQMLNSLNFVDIDDVKEHMEKNGFSIEVSGHNSTDGQKPGDYAEFSGHKDGVISWQEYGPDAGFVWSGY